MTLAFFYTFRWHTNITSLPLSLSLSRHIHANHQEKNRGIFAPIQQYCTFTTFHWLILCSLFHEMGSGLWRCKVLPCCRICKVYIPVHAVWYACRMPNQYSARLHPNLAVFGKGCKEISTFWNESRACGSAERLQNYWSICSNLSPHFICLE